MSNVGICVQALTKSSFENPLFKYGIISSRNTDIEYSHFTRGQICCLYIFLISSLGNLTKSERQADKCLEIHIGDITFEKSISRIFSLLFIYP
jgi:hypothetical protein